MCFSGARTSVSSVPCSRLLSTILIVAGNLIAGQLIERTKTKAGKARPWILLSTVVLCAACILMFVIPHDANMIVRMVWYAISYNLYYSVAYPLYNTANSTLIPTSTRNSSQRGLLASATNVASLGVMGAGSMVFPTLAGFLLFDANENPVYGAWMVMFIVVGVFTALCCILQYYFTRERVTEETINVPKEQHKKVSVAKQLSAVGKEPFWWIIIIFYLVFQFSGGMKKPLHAVLLPVGARTARGHDARRQRGSDADHPRRAGRGPHGDRRGVRVAALQ